MLLGVAAASPVLMHLLQSCEQEKTLQWSPTFFNKQQAHLIADLVDQILPKTETPGGLGVGVDSFIDKMVAEVYTEKQQNIFLSGLDSINKRSKSLGKQFFSDLNNQAKYDLLHTMESEINYLDRDTQPNKKPFFMEVKELALLGYFTSEEIMRNQLDYIPIPTQLIGCEPMAADQKLRVGNGF